MYSAVRQTDIRGKSKIMDWLVLGQTLCHPRTPLHTFFVFFDALDKQTFYIHGCEAWILYDFMVYLLKIYHYK